MELNEKQLEMCTGSRWDFSDLRAIFLNCTLKKSPEMSHTEGLWQICKAIFEKNGVQVSNLPKSRRIEVLLHNKLICA